MLNKEMEDRIILETAIKKLSESFDEFVGSCLDADGKTKAPDYKSIMKARGCLPAYCNHALAKKHNASLRDRIKTAT